MTGPAHPRPYAALPRPPLSAAVELVSVPEALDRLGRRFYPDRWPAGWREDPATRLTPPTGEELPPPDSDGSGELVAVVLAGLVQLLGRGQVRAVAAPTTSVAVGGGPGFVAGLPPAKLGARETVEVAPATWLGWQLLEFEERTKGASAALARRSELLLPRPRAAEGERGPSAPVRVSVYLVADDVTELGPGELAEAAQKARRRGRCSDWPPWKRAAWDLLTATGSCTRAELCGEWLRLHDAPPEPGKKDGKPALTFGKDTVRVDSLDRELNRLRNKWRAGD